MNEEEWPEDEMLNACDPLTLIKEVSFMVIECPICHYRFEKVRSNKRRYEEHVAKCRQK